MILDKDFNKNIGYSTYKNTLCSKDKYFGPESIRVKSLVLHSEDQVRTDDGRELISGYCFCVWFNSKTLARREY